MNQQWRRNIKKAAKEGATTRVDADDLRAGSCRRSGSSTHTAERDHFTPRPLSYFQTMFAALRAEEPDRIVLYTARHEGDLVAATILVRSAAHLVLLRRFLHREARGARPNAAQGDDLDSLGSGADAHDLRGITDTLDPDDPYHGVSSSSRSAPAARPSSTPRRRVGPPAELADLPCSTST